MFKDISGYVFQRDTFENNLLDGEVTEQNLSFREIPQKSERFQSGIQRA